MKKPGLRRIEEPESRELQVCEGSKTRSERSAEIPAWMRTPGPADVEGLTQPHARLVSAPDLR